MGKQRKGPSKKQREVVDGAAGEDVGAGENELGEADDFDHFLETLDDNSDSEEEVDEGDPAEDDDSVDDTSDDDDESYDDDDMEPEEEQLNEDEEESEEGEESDEQEDTDDRNEEEGEEGIPLQNGIGGEEEEDDSYSDEAAVETPKGKKGMSAKGHKMDLQKLQETDPEFFTFLKENDADLLNFNDSDEDDSDSEGEESLHKPPETLEEASDSEAEEDRMDDTSDDHKKKVKQHLDKRIVDINVISHWQTQLSSTRDITVFTNTVEALKCAVAALSQAEADTTIKWRVDGSANFNALIRLCIKEVKGFCVRFLCGNNNATLSENMFDQKPFDVKEKSKQKWTKLRPKLKSYMDIIVQLLKCLGNSDAISSVLRHCQRMSGFWAVLGIKSLKMLRCLISIWAQGEDSCRVLAFLSIIRITNYNKDLFLLPMFKQMYISYVANCKFTSVNTWPAINFMRSSLVELYLLDTNLAYSVAFPFIRQLAIHLRNALSPTAMSSNEGKLKRSEAHRVVYSWQFIHSLHLWVDVLATNGSSADSKEDSNLKLLIYPVVQICMGTVKLIPTKKFIPIRFHIIRMLIKLQEKTGVFIPVLPHITEVLRMTDFSNKNSSAFKFSVRPLDLTCCLKSEASETGYLKAVAENAFECMLLYCKAIGTELGYPEILTPTLMYMKTFLKKECKNVEVYKKFKLLLEKIEANSKYVSEKRNKAMEEGTVTLADKKSHKILQVQMQTSKPHPPILVFAAEYFKTNLKAQLKSQRSPIETKEERLIPKLSDLKKQKKATAAESRVDFDEPMFKSDESDDDGFETKLDNPKHTKTKKRKMQSGSIDGEDDDDSNSKTLTKKNKSKQKKIKKKQSGKSLPTLEDCQIQDELVDYELSD